MSAAASKGRTSSLGLGPSLRRFCAISVAAALYFSIPFVPTRLNCADDPTRMTALRPPSGSFDVSSWSLDELRLLLGLPRLRRWASNWARLLLSLCGPALLLLRDRSTYRRSSCPSLWFGEGQDSWVSVADTMHPLDFDSTLGYPGEGPRQWNCLPGPRLPWGLWRGWLVGCVLVLDLSPLLSPFLPSSSFLCPFFLLFVLFSVKSRSSR